MNKLCFINNLPYILTLITLPQMVKFELDSENFSLTLDFWGLPLRDCFKNPHSLLVAWWQQNTSAWHWVGSAVEYVQVVRAYFVDFHWHESKCPEEHEDNIYLFGQRDQIDHFKPTYMGVFVATLKTGIDVWLCLFSTKCCSDQRYFCVIIKYSLLLGIN